MTNSGTPPMAYLNLQTGRILEGATRRQVFLSDLKGIFADGKVVEDTLAAGDLLVYEVLEIAQPAAEGELNFGVSILQPGKLGSEYFMTRGHTHQKANAAEIYFCLKGTGYLLLQAERGASFSVKMRPGTLAYAPPYHAHRTVNTGPDEFICFYAVPADAGHNYAANVQWPALGKI